jgi:hypothetical protein
VRHWETEMSIRNEIVLLGLDLTDSLSLRQYKQAMKRKPLSCLEFAVNARRISKNKKVREICSKIIELNGSLDKTESF